MEQFILGFCGLFAVIIYLMRVYRDEHVICLKHFFLAIFVALLGPFSLTYQLITELVLNWDFIVIRRK